MTVDTSEQIETDTPEETEQVRPPRRRLRLGLAIVLGVLLLGAGGGYAWHSSTQLPVGVAFRVADRDVTADDLEHYGRTMRALYGVEAPTDPAKVDAFRRALAKAYAFGMVVEGEAQRREIVIADKTAGDVLGRYIRDQFGEGSEARDKFIELLGAAGTNERAVVDEVKRQLMLGRLFGELTSDVEVGEVEVRRAYDTRKSELGAPEQRTLQNIVVTDKQAATTVLEELRAGARFADVAARVSIDASTKDKGGSLGEVAAAQLEDDYAKAAFATPKGDVFGPVKTAHGWNVGRAVAVKEAQPLAFDAIRDRLRDALGLEKAIETWRSWLVERVGAADIRYADQYLPKDPDALPDAGPGMPSVGRPDEQPDTGGR